MTETAPAPESAPVPRHRLTALLAGMMVVSAMPLNLLGVLAALILPDLDITRSQLGFALSTVTAVGGALSMVAGRITDAVGGRRTLRGAFVLGGLALISIALAPSYAWLMGAMVFTGLMQAFSNPSTNWVVAANFPPGRRGLVTGIKQSGVQASLFLCGVGLPPIAEAAGWRVSVATLIAFPVVGLAATAVVPAHERSPFRRSAGTTRIRHPSTIRWLAAYSFTTGIGQSSVLSFVPLYANEEVGLSLAAAGVAGALIGFLGVASRILWTQRAERFSAMTIPLGIITLGSIISAAALLSAMSLHGPALWFGVVVAGATTAASNAVVQLATVMVAPVGTTGRASGLVIVFFLAGNTIGPSAFGWLVDRTSHYQAGWTMVLSAFVAALVILLAWHRTPRSR
jgi:predicted MFS family arabinose efflux permease